MRPRFMSNHRKDLSEPKIREALELAGFMVWDTLPFDLLTWRPDKGFLPLECKTPTQSGSQRRRSDQEEQTKLLKLTGTPVALTPEEALRAVGAA